MFKQLTYRQKNYLLAAGIFLLSLISYQFAFENTIDLATKCSNLERELKRAEQAPEKINLLKQRLAMIDRTIGNSNAGERADKLLLNRVGAFCKEHEITIWEFPEPHYSYNKQYRIQTCRVKVKGGFTDLLQLVYALEQKYNTGKVVAVQFDSQRDLRTKRLELSATVFVQNVGRENLGVRS